MATKAKAKKQAERADLLEKEPTQLHTDFTSYIKEQTGYDADEKTVQLAVILRMDFQRSEVNQARLQARKAAKQEQAEARAAKRAEKAEAKAAKAETKSAKAPAKKAAAKKAPARRRAKKVAATEESF